MTTAAPRFSRQLGLTLRRCLSVYGVMLAIAMVLFATLVYQRYRALELQDYGLAGAVDVEKFLMPILLLTAMAWQCFSFNTALCHGVSRKTYMQVSAMGAAAMAFAVSVIMMIVRWVFLATGAAGACLAVGCRVTEPFSMRRSEQFLYAWDRVSWSNISSSDGVEVSPVLPAGPLFMFLKFFSLMLAYVALGMLVGAVLAWAADKSVWLCGVSVVVIYYAGQQMTLPGPDTLYLVPRMHVLDGFYDMGSLQNRLLQAAAGRLITYPKADVEVGTFVVWIPLAEALILFALCVWIAYLLTKRREIHPARQRVI